MNGRQTQSDAELHQHLLNLELQLMDPFFRKDRDRVSALIAADFREFGSSGREWSRETILDSLAEESDWSAPAVEDFAIQAVAPSVLLVTYRTIHPDKRSLRSSLWIREGDAWRMLFHQGTRYPES